MFKKLFAVAWKKFANACWAETLPLIMSMKDEENDCPMLSAATLTWFAGEISFSSSSRTFSISLDRSPLVRRSGTSKASL